MASVARAPRSSWRKSAHHGSRTSSTEAFLRAVRPHAVVLSVQRDSRFGHPHPAVINRYRALGARIFRTDEHGAITVRTDGQSIWVHPYIGAPTVLSTPTLNHLAETLTPPAAAPR
jgi:competence protein ComEC